jgi:membrane-bound lytic murein transglycosylase B
MIGSRRIYAVCAALALIGAAGINLPAAAQISQWFPFLAAPSTTPPTTQSPGGPAAPAAPAVTGSVPGPKPGGAPEWSGQPGSSGHPLMTTEAILAAAQNFPNCIESLWSDAARRGVSRTTFDTYARGLTPDLRIMDLMDTQPEFTKAFWDYLDLLVSDNRIKRGREILAQHAPLFDAVEKAYGVDRHIVVAIWGIESNFSTSGGDRPVIRSTATLACVGRRQPYFRDEFLATLEILNRGDISPDRLKGSWAGAFGPTQFMPTSFKRYAVDFDGDGRRDVVDSIDDLVASTANNLKVDGWSPGQTWGYEVTLPAGFNYLLADNAKTMPVRDWEKIGVTRIGGKGYPRPTDRAYLFIPAGASGPAFLMLNNFRVLMKYNPAEAYALAIGHLADRMRGDGSFVTAWPRHERVLTSAERYELQAQLIRRGFDIGGEPNGRINARSRSAIKSFQVSQGLVPDGFASAEMLERLRRQ